MRDCPVCGSKERTNPWEMSFLVPDGWELPTRNYICLCDNCQMIYVDNDKNQSDYDAYYKERYDSELTLTSDLVHERLDGLIDFIQDADPWTDARIVDFGGGEGYVERKLRKFGYQDVSTVNVGDELPDYIDFLVASHVLEHVYDVKSVMDKLTSHLNAGAKFIIDVPDADMMVRVNTSPILDYNQKHINHFTTKTLMVLMGKYGFSPTNISRYTAESHDYPSIRVLFERVDEAKIYDKAMEWCQSNIETKMEKLKKINERVIVWGCGDTCMLLLNKVPLDVAHYVDLDPAYRNQTINGIPILDHVESDYPILVMAQISLNSVLSSIQKAKLSNRIIVI